jgi:hypothetical protein
LPGYFRTGRWKHSSSAGRPAGARPRAAGAVLARSDRDHSDRSGRSSVSRLGACTVVPLCRVTLQRGRPPPRRLRRYFRGADHNFGVSTEIAGSRLPHCSAARTPWCVWDSRCSPGNLFFSFPFLA